MKKPPRIKVPQSVRAGEIVEIKTLATHVMETGNRKDADGNVIGRVTSGSPSPTLGKNIGLAYVPRALAKSGTPLVVDIRGKRVEAVVVKTPFYKRPRT